MIDVRNDVVRVDEVATRLELPKKTHYNWRYKGIGPRGHRIGKHLRHHWSNVREWLDAQQWGRLNLSAKPSPLPQRPPETPKRAGSPTAWARR